MVSAFFIEWILLMMLQKAELEQETNKLQAEKTGGSNEHLRWEVNYFVIMSLLICLLILHLQTFCTFT